MVNSEEDLITIAQWSEDDKEAAEAMRELQDKYDSTYMFCHNCDDLVTKLKDCCMNVDTSVINDKEIIF